MDGEPQQDEVFIEEFGIQTKTVRRSLGPRPFAPGGGFTLRAVPTWNVLASSPTAQSIASPKTARLRIAPPGFA